jgi:hypothetical protein
MLAMDGQPGAQAPANPGKTTLLPGLVAIKAMEGFNRKLVCTRGRAETGPGQIRTRRTTPRPVGRWAEQGRRLALDSDQE